MSTVLLEIDTSGDVAHLVLSQQSNGATKVYWEAPKGQGGSPESGWEVEFSDRTPFQKSSFKLDDNGRNRDPAVLRPNAKDQSDPYKYATKKEGSVVMDPRIQVIP